MEIASTSATSADRTIIPRVSAAELMFTIALTRGIMVRSALVADVDAISIFVNHLGKLTGCISEPLAAFIARSAVIIKAVIAKAFIANVCHIVTGKIFFAAVAIAIIIIQTTIAHPYFVTATISYPRQFVLITATLTTVAAFSFVTVFAAIQAIICFIAAANT